LAVATVTVLYPDQADHAFDFDYYARTHLPLLFARWGSDGLVSVEALRGVAAADGGAPPFVATAILRFTSPEALKAAMTGPHAGEIMADVANFTAIQPILQINEAVPG